MKYSELDPRGRIPLGKIIPGSPKRIGEDSPSKPDSQTSNPSQHIGEDTPRNQEGQAQTSPQHIGEDAPSKSDGQDSTPPQHIGEDAPSKPDSQAPTAPQHIGEDSQPPVDSTPGIASSEKLAIKGRKAENFQNEAIETHKNDKTYIPNDSNTYLPMNRRYNVIDDDILTPADSSGGDVNAIMEDSDIRLDPHQPWTYREVVSRGQPEDHLTVMAMFSSDQKAILAQQRYAVSDVDPLPEAMAEAPGWNVGDPIPPRLPAGEILWQQYKDVAGDTAGDLRFIISHPVANSDTNRVITEAHAAKGLADEEKGTFTPLDSNRENQLGDIWHQFLGTDNVKGILYMVADHHNELGNKAVTKIHSWTPNGPGANGFGSLVIELGPR